MKTSQIILTSLSVLGVAGIGYAIYFDHRRQTDPAFRKSLRKESKKSSKADKKEAAKRAQQEDGFIQDLLQEVRSPGTFPAGVEEREQYFLKYVSLGEQLFAVGTDKYLEAAAAFFKALKVYPQPVELIMIYQKAVPKEVFDTIMRIVSKDIATGGGEGGDGMTAAGLDEVDDDGPSPSAAAAAKKAEAAQEDDEEEEIDEDKAEDKDASTSASATTSSAAQPAQQQGTDSGTTSSQEWDTLSATSLNETGVMVTPNAPASTTSESHESSATPSAAATAEEEESAAAPTTTEEPKLTSIDTSASVTKESVSTPSKQNFTSGWSPAPVFAGSSPRAEKKADPLSGAEDKSE